MRCGAVNAINTYLNVHAPIWKSVWIRLLLQEYLFINTAKFVVCITKDASVKNQSLR